jgi:hypothetical protein
MDDMFNKIKKSIEYNALDHKWIIRDYLWNKGQDIESEQDKYLYQDVVSSFNYYSRHYDVFQSDRSLKAITELCSDEALTLHTGATDSQVFHLSNVFNEIIESTRQIYKCYDCGTNARAIFLKLIKEYRGIKFITFEEQARMKTEYSIKHDQQDIDMTINACYQHMFDVEKNTVYIMSISIQDFGHVWVIEKQFINGVPRYHHYQTCFRSHLLLDFIESMDYGRDIYQSLDIKRFFRDVHKITSNLEEWKDIDYRLFAKLFAFLPTHDVTKPNPGFCFTSITY